MPGKKAFGFLEVPMKRVAVTLLAALCAPAVPQAQEGTLASRAATALTGFGEAFRSACLRGPRDGRRLRIAVAEMDPGTRFTRSAARTITDTIDAVLAADPALEVVPRRLRGELAEIRKEFGLRTGPGPAPGGDGLDGFVTVNPAADDRGRPAVSVAVYAAGADCGGPGRVVVTGDIRDAPDQPQALFQNAARQLNDGGIERVVVMPTEVGDGLGIDNATRIVVDRLQRQLVSAIRDTFSRRSRTSLTDRPLPAVEPYGSGMAVATAWQARLRLDRAPHGFDVAVEFRGPRGVFEVSGQFAPDLLPATAGAPVLKVRAAKAPFRVGDTLDVRIEMLRPGRLFCFILDQSGEATLLYPTYETRRERDNLFQGSKTELKFPEDFRLPIALGPGREPAVEFFHCIATAQPLRGDLESKWFKNTAAQRALDMPDQPPSIAPGEARDLLFGLRDSEGYGEGSARIEIVSE